MAQELTGGARPQKSPLDFLAGGNASARSGGTDASARLGTARWMTSAEASYTAAFQDSNLIRNRDGLWEGTSQGQIWLGLDAETGAPLGYGDDRHVTVICGSRGGKGAGIIVPNLCLWPGSCIVIDPKGENASITARRRGNGSEFTYGIGQDVRILDPYGKVHVDQSLKGRFNPLAEIDVSGVFAVADATVIAGSIVESNSKDPFWGDSARDLVTALILHVLTASHFKEAQKTLVSVHKLITGGDWIARDLIERNTPPTTEDKKKPLPSGKDLLWRGMQENKAFGGLVAAKGSELKEMNEKTRDGIVSHAVTAISFLNDFAMQSVLETSDFRLDELKTNPNGVTLYLSLPQELMVESHYKWLRIIINLATAKLQRIPGVGATGHRTLFVLDEFAGLKRMGAIEHGAAQIAGAGIKFLFILQNLPQLKDVYEKSWETFLDNSSLRIFFQVDGETTGDYLVKRLGETEVWRESQSGSEARTTGYTETDGVTDTKGQTLTDGITHTTGKTTTKGRTMTRGTTNTRGTTDTRGLTSTNGTTRTIGKTDTSGDSRSRGGGRSRTLGDTEGITDGMNEGTGGSMTHSGPASSGIFFGVNNNDANSWSEASSFNRGTSHSRALSTSDSLANSLSWTDGTSRSRALSASDANSLSRAQSSSIARSQSQAESLSTADSTSEAMSVSKATSQSVANTVSSAISRSVAKSLSDTRTQGRAESVHKRSLLNSDEAARLLARIDDRRNSSYPGRILALISGQHPLLLRRINYFESGAFAGLFDPNPEYKPPKYPALPPLVERTRRIAILKVIHDLGAAKEREEMDAQTVRDAAAREAAKIIANAKIKAEAIKFEAKQAAAEMIASSHETSRKILGDGLEATKAKADREQFIEKASTEAAVQHFAFWALAILILIIVAVATSFYLGGRAWEYGKYLLIGTVGIVFFVFVYEIIDRYYENMKSEEGNRLRRTLD